MTTGAEQRRALQPAAKRFARRPRYGPGIAERYGLFVAWALVIVGFSIARPETFGTFTNFQTIFGTQWVIVLITLALVVPLVAGEFDISIASVFTFGGTAVASLNTDHGLAIGWAIAIALVLVCLFGAVNGLITVYIGVPSIVTTLGTGTLLTGILVAVFGRDIIILESLDFNTFSIERIFGLPTPFYIVLAVCVVLWYLLDHTPYGRYVSIVGSGPQIATLVGVPVPAIRLSTFVFSAGLAGLAGVLLTGAQGAADPNVGESFLLPAFAGAFLGATTIRPGEFNVWGSFAAIFFLVTGITGLQLVGLAGWVEDVFYGGALILAVTVGRVLEGGRTITVGKLLESGR